jgi:hypothetical protein
MLIVTDIKVWRSTVHIKAADKIETELSWVVKQFKEPKIIKF